MPGIKLEDKYSWEQLCERVIVKGQVKPADQLMFRKWFATKEHLGFLFNDPILWKHAFIIDKKLNKKNKDHFTVVCGKERMGKSTLAAQLNAVVSPQFRTESVCFKLKDFIKGVRNSQKGDSFQLDEGALFLFSYDANSTENKLAKKLFTVMGVKNLHVCVCIPSFFIVDKYVRDHRVDTLIYVTARGKYTVYRGKAIKILSKEGDKFKKIEGVRVPYGTFWQGEFRRDMPRINDFSSETYDELKVANIDEFLEEAERLAEKVEGTQYISVKEAKSILGLGDNTIIRMIKQGKLKGFTSGGKWMINKESLEQLSRQDSEDSGQHGNSELYLRESEE